MTTVRINMLIIAVTSLIFAGCGMEPADPGENRADTSAIQGQEEMTGNPYIKQGPGDLIETDQIIITEDLYNSPGIRDKLVATRYQSFKVRGKAESVSTYLVHDVKGFYKAAMERQIQELF